jgi:hypothetical protein
MQVAGKLAACMVCACVSGAQTNIRSKSGPTTALLRHHNHSNGPRSRPRTCFLDDLGTDVMRPVQLERVLHQAEGIHKTCMPTLTPEKVWS